MPTELYEKINEKLDTVLETQARILGYIEYDPFTQTPGLVQRVRALEGEMQEVRDKAKAKKGIHISFAYLAGSFKFLVAGIKALFLIKG